MPFSHKTTLIQSEHLQISRSAQKDTTEQLQSSGTLQSCPGPQQKPTRHVHRPPCAQGTPRYTQGIYNKEEKRKQDTHPTSNKNIRTTKLNIKVVTTSNHTKSKTTQSNNRFNLSIPVPKRVSSADLANNRFRTHSSFAIALKPKTTSLRVQHHNFALPKTATKAKLHKDPKENP